MRIKGFENIYYLTEFTVTKSRDAHSVCTFCAAINPAEEDAFLVLAGVEIQAEYDENEKPVCIFVGRVEEVRLRRTLHAAEIEVRAVSNSVAEDEEAHTRIWQNPQKKLGAMLSAAQLALIKTDLRLSKSLTAQQYAPPVLQNQETNFAFLRRIAAYMDTPLWVEDTKQGRGTIVLAETLSDAVRTIAPDDMIRYEAVKDQRGRKHITLNLKTYLPLGAKVKIPQEKSDFVISGLRIYLEHAVYEFCYQLEPYVPWKYEFRKVPHLEKTYYLQAKVENNKDPENKGRIQLSFSKEEIQDMDRERLWIPYQSPYTGKAGGIVFLPDVGDAVQVVVSNEGIYVSSALRERALDEECQKTEDKYIGNNTKQRIFFQEKALKIASGEYTVLLDEEGIELTVGESKITMRKDRIVLHQGKTELTLDAKGIYLNAGGSKMTCGDQGIIGQSGKDVGLDARGAVQIKGTGRINVSAGKELFLKGNVVHIG